MGEFWFVLKTFAVTVLVVVVLQLKVGDSRIENHIEAALHTSGAIGYLQEAADGGVLAVTRIFHSATTWINSKISFSKHRAENQSGQREIFPEFKRSEAYVRRNSSAKTEE